MIGLRIWFTKAALWTLLLFADKEEYTSKVTALPSMDEKHSSAEIDGWHYRSFAAGNGDYDHSYYHYSSHKDDAPVLLLLHGLNLDARTFLNVTELAEHWQLVAYNLPERCPLYSGRYDNWRMVVDDFVDQYPGTIAAVAGVSFGGGIALHLAANHPKVKATRLLLLSTTMLNATEEQRRQSRTIGSWVGSLPDYKIYYLMEKLIARNEDEITEAATNGRDVRTILEMKHPEFFRQVALSMDDYDPSVDAARVTIPTLVLMGGKDDLYTDEHEAMMRRYLPHLEYEVIPEGTHSMAFLRGEQVAEHIIGFCRRVCDSTITDVKKGG